MAGTDTAFTQGLALDNSPVIGNTVRIRYTVCRRQRPLPSGRCSPIHCFVAPCCAADRTGNTPQEAEVMVGIAPRPLVTRIRTGSGPLGAPSAINDNSQGRS